MAQHEHILHTRINHNAAAFQLYMKGFVRACSWCRTTTFFAVTDIATRGMVLTTDMLHVALQIVL